MRGGVGGVDGVDGVHEDEETLDETFSSTSRGARASQGPFSRASTRLPDKIN
jgi:hypothetical protein